MAERAQICTYTLYKHLVESLPKGVEAVLAAREPTSYECQLFWIGMFNKLVDRLKCNALVARIHLEVEVGENSILRKSKKRKADRRHTPTVAADCIIEMMLTVSAVRGGHVPWPIHIQSGGFLREDSVVPALSLLLQNLSLS